MVRKASPSPVLTTDALDHKILALIQVDALIPAARIGSSIGLSAAAVQRRIKRMRENGVIESISAQVKPKAVGLPITCFVTVDLDCERTDEIDSFSRLANAHPQVQQCYYVTGPTDFVLIVMARDMAHYEAFTRQVFLTNPNVKSFTTHVSLSRIKATLQLPIMV